jgi:hypothetical protein
LTLNASNAGKSQNFVFQTIGLIGAVEIAFQNHDPLFLSTVAGGTPQRRRLRTLSKIASALETTLSDC